MKTMPKQLVLLSAILALAACAPKRAPEAERAVVADLAGGTQAAVAPLIGELERSPITACERLAELAQADKPQGRAQFAYLGQMTPDGQIALDLSASPFVQMYIGENFKVDSDEEFLAKIEAAFKAGQLPEEKYKMIMAMKEKGELHAVKFPMINAGLEETFPGVFGAAKPMQKALHALLLSKVAKLEELDPRAMAEALLARAPLFPADRSWNSWAEDSRRSLAAAARGFRDASAANSPLQERVCSLVLYQRSFAQLLQIKGYQRAELTAEGKVEPLSKDMPEFKKQALAGAVMDLQAGTNVMLEPSALMNYNPAMRVLMLAKVTPEPGDVQRVPADLGESLAFLEGMVHMYAATAPVDGAVTGDIRARNRAILPQEAHSLALGVLMMQLKNLAGIHVKMVDGKGVLAVDEKSAIGAVLASVQKQGSSEVRVKLVDVLRLLKSISYLDQALTSLQRYGSAELASRAPVYSEGVQRQLFGFLLPKLKMLKLPLVLLASRMAEGTHCVAETNWDLASGKVQPLAVCAAETRAQFKEVMGIVAADTNSRWLQQKSR